MGTTNNVRTGPGVKLHESNYTHANLPTAAEKAKLPHLLNVTSDIQNQIDNAGGGFDPSFGAGLYLPLTEDPASATLIENLGHFGANTNFTRFGSWTGTTTANGGRYWTGTDTNAKGLRQNALVDINTATAAYVSHDATTIVIDDTANDLEALFEHKNLAITRRKYKVVVRSTNTGNKAISAYIGGIAKSGNRYTITVYTTSDGSTNTWNGWEALGTVIYWGIYSAELDYAASALNLSPEGITIGFFYKPSDPTANDIHLCSMWDGFVANVARCLQYVVYQGTTNGSITIAHRNAANGQVDFEAVCLTADQWVGVAVRIKNAVASDLIVNGELIAIDNANTTAGMLTVEGLAWFVDPIGTTSVLPNGSAVAYPTLWRGIVPLATINAWYHYHKNLLGIAG